MCTKGPALLAEMEDAFATDPLGVSASCVAGAEAAEAAVLRRCCVDVLVLLRRRVALLHGEDNRTDEQSYSAQHTDDDPRDRTTGQTVVVSIPSVAAVRLRSGHFSSGEGNGVEVVRVHVGSVMWSASPLPP